MGDESAGKPAVRPRRTFRKVLLIMLGVAALGAVATAGAAFIAYDQATEIDREFPEVVVREYVDAVLMRRDDSRAQLYVCKNPEGLAPILQLRDQLAQGTSGGGAPQVVLGPRTVEESGAVVVAELQFRQASNGVTQKELQLWRFSMVDEEGWRVCGATRVPLPSPSPSTQPTLQ